MLFAKGPAQVQSTDRLVPNNQCLLNYGRWVDFPLEVIPDPIPDPTAEEGEGLFQPKHIQALYRALATLKPTEKTLIFEQFWKDKSVEEMAESRGLSAAALSAALNEVLIQLKIRVGQELEALESEVVEPEVLEAEGPQPFKEANQKRTEESL